MMTTDRTVLSPAEVAAMLHLSKAANLPGLAASSAKMLKASRDLELEELSYVLDRNNRPRIDWYPQPLATVTPRQAVRRSLV